MTEESAEFVSYFARIPLFLPRMFLKFRSTVAFLYLRSFGLVRYSITLSS